MLKSITHLFQHTLVIYRLRTTSGFKKTFQSTATVEGMLQNRAIDMETKLGIVSSRLWVAYVDVDEDVKAGDQIIHDNKKFLVKEVVQKDYGVNTHLECLLSESPE